MDAHLLKIHHQIECVGGKGDIKNEQSQQMDSEIIIENVESDFMEQVSYNIDSEKIECDICQMQVDLNNFTDHAIAHDMNGE